VKVREKYIISNVTENENWRSTSRSGSMIESFQVQGVCKVMKEEKTNSWSNKSRRPRGPSPQNGNNLNTNTGSKVPLAQRRQKPQRRTNCVVGRIH
jgi:hypothetical protein